MRAMLALEQRDFKKHSAVISNASILRNRSDCDGFCICGGKETDERIRDAGDVPAAVEGFFRQQGRAL